MHEDKPGNLEREVHHSFGDVEGGFSEADLVCEEVFDCAEINHAQMEPHAALAEYDAERDRLTLHSVTQVPFLCAFDAGALPRHGQFADPRHQTICRRRLRCPDGDIELRDRCGICWPARPAAR